MSLMDIFGPRTGHGPLFDELCQQHGLDRKTKSLLQSVVKKYQTPRPAEIFIEPDLLRRAAADSDFDEVKGDLQKLYDTWFRR